MDTIKIKLQLIANVFSTPAALERISNLQKKNLPAKLRYWFKKGLDIILAEANRINETKNSIFEEYGEKDSEGKLIKDDIGDNRFIPKLSNENLIKVQNEINSFMNEEVDLGFRKIVIDSNKLPDLDGFEIEILSMFYIDSEDVVKE